MGPFAPFVQLTALARSLSNPASLSPTVAGCRWLFGTGVRDAMIGPGSGFQFRVVAAEAIPSGGRLDAGGLIEHRSVRGWWGGKD
jgi:hypothetical protein